MWSSTNRNPIETAITATEIVAASSSASADKKEILRTFMVSAVYLSPIKPMRTLWLFVRPNIFKVMNPRKESSKYFERVPSDCHYFCTESAVYRPISAPKNGINGKVRTQIRAESGSRKKIVVIITNGVATEINSCGKKRPK